MLVSGWILYVVSILLNYLFYKLHPSSPDNSLTWPVLKEKLQNRYNEMFDGTDRGAEDVDDDRDEEFELIPVVDSGVS